MRVVISVPGHQVVIKVSDEAGGIARSQLADVWMYNSTRLHGGASMGLPLARLYAMYFGGSLQLFPMEGDGGMARCAHACTPPPRPALLGTARACASRRITSHLLSCGPGRLVSQGKCRRHWAASHRPLTAMSPPSVPERAALQARSPIPPPPLSHQAGYGTDAYATFNRLGDANSEHCLNAPIVAGDEDGFAPSEVRDSAPPPTRPEPGHRAGS